MGGLWCFAPRGLRLKLIYWDGTGLSWPTNAWTTCCSLMSQLIRDGILELEPAAIERFFAVRLDWRAV